MGTMRVTLITLVLVSAFVEKGSQSADHQLHCRGSSFGISINSKINQTGHSITRYSIKKPEVHQRSWKLDYNTCVDDIAGSQVFTIEATITAAPPKPDDYEFFPGIGYYKLYTNPSNFSEASFRCSKDGGHLAIINSDAEYNVLANMHRQQTEANTYAFVGFHDQITEGKYITIFGDPLSSTGFLKWNANDPNGGKENCGGLKRDGYFVDIGCQVKLSFFCEYDLSWGYE